MANVAPQLLYFNQVYSLVQNVEKIANNWGMYNYCLECFFLKPALPQQVDFRVNNLESNLRILQLRLQQLELIVSQNNQLSSANNSQIPPKLRRNLSQSEQRKMLDNLATLVVELNQEVKQLTTRVNKLEKLNVK